MDLLVAAITSDRNQAPVSGYLPWLEEMASSVPENGFVAGTHCRYVGEHRNPLASPLLMAALDRLTPNPRARLIDRLVRMGRVADAAAVADRVLIEADHI